MKRCLDIAILILIVPLLAVPFILVAAAVFVSSRGPIIHWSRRIGIHSTTFMMPKFRTMYIHTPTLATHLLTDPHSYLTPIGSFLRKFSLDEIPQIWSIAKGEMSFVGPRPALYNQSDLIVARKKLGVDKCVPGLTGWAQVNGRDDLSVNEKVIFDKFYADNYSILFDLKIIMWTVFKTVLQSNVSH